MSRSLPEKIYEYFYRRRKHEAQQRLTGFANTKIISVGNLTTGGTGKTPAVQWLARRLQDDGRKVAIVGRGYGGEYSARGAVVSDGRALLLNAAQAGDEAVLHARNLEGVPVVIGRDRGGAVRRALDAFAPEMILLDDGFQYWSLARDFDLVLLDARAPFGNEKLLPVGRLREPVEALQRANGVLLTRCDAASASELERAQKQISELTAAPVFQSSHAPHALRNEQSGARLAPEVLRGERVAILSALADNKSFQDSIIKLGAVITSTLARRDHHAWKPDEIRLFAERVKKCGATRLVTTEKDAVKIEARNCTLPLYSLTIEMKIGNDNALYDLIRAHIGR